MPRIEGDPRVGQTLQVIKGEWSAEARFHYQWIVGGVARDGRSTGPAYKVRPEDRGQRVTVEVTGRMDRCEPVGRGEATGRLGGRGAVVASFRRDRACPSRIAFWPAVGARKPQPPEYR